jgi:N-[(2S)-2-amino-2-carboxyethyl]-L-glutamate dehydrogenase
MYAVSFRYLSQADVLACGGADLPATFVDVERVLVLLHRGLCQEPDSILIHWEGPHLRRFIAHAAFVGADVDTAGVKWIGSNPDNPLRRGIPRATAILILGDPQTGTPRAIMDGTVISAMRTAAVVAIAAKRFANADAETLAIVGAGVLGRAQLKALTIALPQLRRARIFDTDRTRAEAALAEAPATLELDVVATAEEAIRGADVVAPATNVGTRDRFIPASWIKPGAFLANVSLNDYLPECVRACQRIVVDTMKQLSVPGLVLADMVLDGQLDRNEVATLGEVLCGERPARRDSGERVFFSPMGLGVEDIINAARILKTAEERNIGRILDLMELPDGAQGPENKVSEDH